MKSFFKLFANESLATTLSVFLMHPGEEFYQRNLAKKTGKALLQTQRSLKILEEVKLIFSERRGKMIFYRANQHHPAFQDLKNAFLKTVSLGEMVSSALEKYQKEIELAWIFGSVAKGEENSESDIDLMVVSSLSLSELSSIIVPIFQSIDREVNPIFLTPQSFLERLKRKDHFLSELIRQPKIWILGSDEDLERFVRRASAKASQSFSSRNSRTF